MKRRGSPAVRLGGDRSASDVPSRWVSGLAVAAACLLALILRCLHLLQDDHYFIVSADSYYFHRMAELLVLNETYFYPTHNQVFPLTMFMGITYPLAFFATVIALITPVSSLDAFSFAARFLPPLLAALTVLVIYIGVSRMFGRWVGVLASFATAIIPYMIFLQAAGYLDRDGLSILLIVLGTLSFYFLSGMRFQASHRGFGWVSCALVVFAIEGLLYIQWGFVGSAILLAVIGAFVVVEVLSRIMPHAVHTVSDNVDLISLPIALARTVARAIPTAVKQSPWKPFALLLGVNLGLIAFRPAMARRLFDQGAYLFRDSQSGTETIQELMGLGIYDVLAYGPLLVAIAVGLYIVLRRHRRADLFLLAWIGVLFVGGLFARRLFLYAAPAFCIVAGVGLGYLLDPRGLRLFPSALATAFYDFRGFLPVLRLGLAALVLFLALWFSVSYAQNFVTGRATSVNADWHEALIWMRENTPEDAVVMTWWDYGYWIFDVAHRVPVVDNGFHTEVRNRDIAHVYVAEDHSMAVDIMTRYGATYLIFSEDDIPILPGITFYALGQPYGDGTSIPPELRNSLYSRSFEEDFQSETSLRIAYRSNAASHSTVVILAIV